MARIRSIKPDFWESEEIAGLSRDARLLYIATWNIADDEGLLRWTAPYLKSSAFIYDDDLSVDGVAALMGELESADLVVTYRVGPKQLAHGWIPSFRRHQKPNRPQPSKLPPPPWREHRIATAYLARDLATCALCGEEILPVRGNSFDDPEAVPPHRGLSLDHIQPRSAGGDDYPSNIQSTHKQCNSRKGVGAGSVNGSVNAHGTLTNPFTPVGEGSGRGEGDEVGGGDGHVERTALELVADEPPPPDPITGVFEAWKESTGHRRAILDSKRRDLIRRRLKDYPADDLADACRGVVLFEHNRGETNGTRYDDLELVLRDAAHIERFRDRYRREEPPPAPRMPKGSDMTARTLARMEANRGTS